jgi:tetratricopeptide (TPR) repeat protein
MGRVMVAEGKLPEAIRLMERARSLSPEIPQIHAALAIAYARSGRKEDAARASRSAGRLEEGPRIEDPIAATMYAESESTLVLFQLGLDALRKQSFAQALGHFEHALQRQPDLLDATLQKAIALNALGRSKEAEPLFDAVLAKRPGSAPALAGKGACAQNRDDYAAAIGYYRRALDVAPDNQIARHNLGRVLRHVGRPAEAAEQFRTLLGQRPHRTDVRLDLASVLDSRRHRGDRARPGRRADQPSGPIAQATPLAVASARGVPA